MKIATAAEEVEVIGGSGRSNNFSVAMNAKMFDILSGSIYQNKIAAVVRELSCNAYDAHVAAGKPQVPIKIHLPTLLAPYFAVSDEGIGLSVDDVMQLYTTYGESRKDKSDDFIGGFGLGSKSPFAYTDHFTVTSVFAGQTSTFAAYRNEEGFPRIDLISSEDTPDQPNGLKVQLAVQASDFNSFKREAEELFAYWDVVPEGISLPPREEWKSIFKSVNGAEMFLLTSKSKRSWEDRADKAQVGMVTYKTSFSAYYTAVNSAARRWLQSNYYLIKVPIGGVDIAVSRETLSETPRTKKYFEAFFTEFASNLETTVKAGIEASKTPSDFLNALDRAEADRIKVYPLTYANVVFKDRKEVESYLAQNYVLFAKAHSPTEMQAVPVHLVDRSWKRAGQPYATDTSVSWQQVFHSMDNWLNSTLERVPVIDDLQNEKFKYKKYRIDTIKDQNSPHQVKLFWFSGQAEYDAFVAAVDAWVGQPFFTKAPIGLLSVAPPNRVGVAPQPKNALSEFWKIVKPLSTSLGSNRYYLDSWAQHATENTHALLSDIETTLEGYYLIGTSRAVEMSEYTIMVREGLSIALQENKPVYMFTKRQLDRVQKNPKLKHLNSIIPELYAKCAEDELWQIQLKHDGQGVLPSEDTMKLLASDVEAAALYSRVKSEPALMPKYSETIWNFHSVEIENKFKSRIDGIKQDYARVLAKYPLLGSMSKEFLPKYIELQKFYNDHHP